MRRIHLKALCLLAAFLLAACGGSNSGSDTVAANPTRGQLPQSPPELISVVTAPALLLALNTLANQQLLAISGTLLCDIAVNHIRYAMVGGDPHCRCTRPILLYAHGTNGEGAVMAAFFASQGHIVVAPNFAGYASSTLPCCPAALLAHLLANPYGLFRPRKRTHRNLAEGPTAVVAHCTPNRRKPVGGRSRPLHATLSTGIPCRALLSHDHDPPRLHATRLVCTPEAL